MGRDERRRSDPSGPAGTWLQAPTNRVHSHSQCRILGSVHLRTFGSHSSKSLLCVLLHLPSGWCSFPSLLGSDSQPQSPARFSASACYLSLEWNLVAVTW